MPRQYRRTQARKYQREAGRGDGFGMDAETQAQRHTRRKRHVLPKNPYPRQMLQVPTSSEAETLSDTSTFRA